MELVSRMMDGSISYDPKARLEPVLSGATVKQGDKIERLKEVRIFDNTVDGRPTRALLNLHSKRDTTGCTGPRDSQGGCC